MNGVFAQLLVPLVVLFGGLCGVGILLLVKGLTPTEVSLRPRSTLAADLRRMSIMAGRKVPVAVGAGLFTLVITRWIVLAVSVGLVVFFWGALFGGAAAERAAYERLEGLAAWTESLRDTIAGAVGLEQAIPATANAASPPIARAINDLSDRLRVRVPMTTALMRFADDLDDSTADLVVAALILNAKLRGPGLRDVLSSLASSVRSEVEMRGRISAGRRGTRKSVQIVVAITGLFVIGLRVLNPDYVEPYGTPLGQLVLLLVAGIFALGFYWLRRLATFQMPARFLQTAPTDLTSGAPDDPDLRAHRRSHLWRRHPRARAPLGCPTGPGTGCSGPPRSGPAPVPARGRPRGRRPARLRIDAATARRCGPTREPRSPWHPVAGWPAG